MEETNTTTKHWKWIKLGEVCDFIGGGTPSKQEKKYWNGNINWASVKDIKGHFLNHTQDTITELGLKNSASSIAEPNEVILITRISPGKTIISNIRTAINQDLKVVKPKFETTSKFLFYYFQAFERELIKKSSGTTVLGITINNLKEIEIPVMDLKEQQAIVSKIEELLSDLENGKQQLLTAQQQLKVYRQSLLKWAFEGKLTENWRNKNLQPTEDSSAKTTQKGTKGKSTLKVHGARVRIPTESQLVAAEPEVGYVPKVRVKQGELPEGWKWERLELHTTLITKGASPRWQGYDYINDESQLLFITSENVRENYIDIDKPKFLNLAFNDIQKRSVLNVGDVLFNLVGASIGRAAIFNINRIANINQAVAIIRLKETLSNKYLSFFLNSETAKQKYLQGVVDVARANLSLVDTRNIEIPVPTIEEQQQVIEELESKLTVCDKIEEAIENSLQQGETLRQSILKRAFEGKLVAFEEKQVYKPKNVYFYQMQLLGYVLKISKEKKISHGEMTTAKYMYLIEKLYDVPTHYKYERWHLGPYPPEMKKAIKNKKFFGVEGTELKVTDEKTLFKYPNPYEQQVAKGINELTEIFGGYDKKDRAHQTELLATVCKVIEDIKSTELATVRQSMEEWKIDLKGSKFKTKAEKFTKKETEECLSFIDKKGWNSKLIQKYALT